MEILIGLLAVAVSIVFGGMSIWIVLRQSYSNVEVQIASQLAELNRIQFENPEVVASLQSAVADDGLLPHLAIKRTQLAMMILNFYEHVYDQHRKYRFIDKEEMAIWDKAILHNLRVNPYLRYHLRHYHHVYTPRFMQLLQILERDIDDNIALPTTSTSQRLDNDDNHL